MNDTEKQKDPTKTAILGVPLLTEEQKTALFERPDHGITPVTGIRRFPTFESWMKNGGVRGRDNYHHRFSSNFSGDYLREAQHFQRFALLYPELFEQLSEAESRLFGHSKHLGDGIKESNEKAYWEAYEKMADLVDADDDPMVIANNQELPHGQVIPNVLTG